jgi:microbial collagenase
MIVSPDEKITFNAAGSFDRDGSIVSYSWDFGDGTNAYRSRVAHSFTSTETFKVSSSWDIDEVKITKRK